MFLLRNKTILSAEPIRMLHGESLPSFGEPQRAHRAFPPFSAIPVRTLWKSPHHISLRISAAPRHQPPNPHPPRRYLHSLIVADPAKPQSPSAATFPTTAPI